MVITSTSTSCILIPIHPKHYHYIYDLIKANNAPFPIYLIFSDHNDVKQFNTELLQEGRYMHFVLEDIMPLSNDLRRLFDNRRSWINVKKLQGLKHLYETTTYDHIIVIDAEIKFLTFTAGAEALIKKSVDTKTILGTDNYNRRLASAINRSTINILPQTWEPKLLALTSQTQYIAWWSTIPIYERQYISGFLASLRPDYITQLDYHSFDFIIYYLYLAYFEYVTLKRLPFSIELAYTINEFDIISKDNLVLWVNSRMYHTNPSYFNSKPELLLVFHLDRMR